MEGKAPFTSTWLGGWIEEWKDGRKDARKLLKTTKGLACHLKGADQVPR